MYSPANFAPLSNASLKRLIKGQTVRVKHGTGLHLGLSKAQMKKHMASKKKGQGGYNLTLDPFQSQMHGEGFFDDIGSAFKSLGNSFVENVAKPVANEVVREGKARGRKVASQLIHEGIPFASSSLGGLAGTTLGGLTGNPLGAEAGEVIGQQLGQYGGTKLADYVGKRTGLGMKQIIMSPAMKEAMKPRLLEGGTLLIDQPFTARQAVNTTGDLLGTLGFGMKKRGRPRKGGTLLIDQPFTARQAVNTAGSFIKNPGTLGFGIDRVPQIPPQYRGRGLRGGTALIDQPFTARQAVNTAGSFIKNPAGALGFGLRGGTALIDQPFTARQAVNTTGSFIKNPAGTLGFGMKMKKGKRGGALIQAGY